MTDLLQRALLGAPADNEPPASTFAFFARPKIVNRLVDAGQLIAASFCLLLFLAYVAEVTSPRDLLDRAAILILLGGSTLLMAVAFARSERRAAHEALLRESGDRISLAAQSANLGLWVWNQATDAFWASPTTLSVLGLAPETMMTMETMLGLVHPDDLAGVRAGIGNALTAQKTQEFEYRHISEGGQLHWHRIRASAAHDQDGKLLLSGAVVDITDHRRMEAEVESQRRSLAHLTRVGMLGELGGALAHELKQPLTAILSNAQALQRLLDHTAIDMVEVRAVVRDIIHDDSRAADVIQHLRSLLKRDEFRGEPLDLNRIVREALDLVHNDLIARHITVSTAFHSPALPVLADTVQLQQLFLNLIFNAAEAMAESASKNGVLLIATDIQDDASAHVMVSDTGPGLKPEILGKLFEPFVSTKMHGLGLGLSISRAIAASHSGRIWAQNNSGRGATFHVAIPLAVKGRG